MPVEHSGDHRSVYTVAEFDALLFALRAELDLATGPPIITIPIPTTGAVLSMVGLNFNKAWGGQPADYMPAALQSLFSTAPYTMTKVSYPASWAKSSIPDGVKAFDTAVRARPGVQKIAFGHGQGAQVMSRWMRTYATDGTAPGTDELMFVLIGNPLRSTGGYGIGRDELDGVTGLATPIDTPWTIVDVARRYDGWADWVTDATNRMAVQNAEAGKQAYHMHYENVDVYAATNTVWQDGNTTYVLTQEEPPYYKSLIGKLPDSLKSSIREHIEAGHSNRPTFEPAVEVTPSVGWWELMRKALIDTEVAATVAPPPVVGPPYVLYPSATSYPSPTRYPFS